MSRAGALARIELAAVRADGMVAEARAKKRESGDVDEYGVARMHWDDESYNIGVCHGLRQAAGFIEEEIPA